MKLREGIQYFLGIIPLVMLASLILTFALSPFAPKPEIGAGGYADPYILSAQDASKEKIFRVAGSGSRIIAEPQDIGADGDSQPEPDIAALFGIQSARWSAVYVRAGEGKRYSREGASPAIAAALAGREPRDRDLPCLVFLGKNGQFLVLEPLRDFNGKTPLVRMNQTNASLNTPFALNLPAEDSGTGASAKGLGSLDLGLTEEGRRKLTLAGIPTAIPAAIERVTPRSNTILLNTRLTETIKDGALAMDPINRWYRSRYALYFPGAKEEAYWKVFTPLLKNELNAARERRATPRNGTYGSGYRFKVDSQRMWRASDGADWKPFIVKGVNLGSSLPGRAFTEFSRDEALYWHWFAMMRDMNLNSIRIYTLFPPEFYRALAAFNRENPGRELFLLQEIWPEEAPPNRNLLDRDYTQGFYREIEYAIGAIHGGITVPERPGRAFGFYDTDMSPWTAAFLIGRELESDEVLATDTLNHGWRYEGRWFSVRDGSPTEAWLAAACDKTALFETERWGQTRPISVVSWPPLDPIPHWVEWRDPWLNGKAPANDRAEVVIDRIDVSPDFEPGFFSAWHIYPNYPDFMIATPWYAKYRDDIGEFRYGGYLKELRMFSRRYPILLAEFGLSTSLGTAHIAPDGLDHGGISEVKQGEGLIRMAKAALTEGYMGTVIFEWADEWAKQTWITAPFMIPLSGHQSWHNALDPEQYYGIVATDARDTAIEGVNLIDSGANVVSMLGTAGNEEFLTVILESETPWSDVSGTVSIGFDVLDPGSGIRNFAENAPVNGRGLEFLVEIPLPLPEKGQIAARLLAVDTCNAGNNRFSITGAKPEKFERVRILVNKETVDSLGNRSEALYADRSSLIAGERGVFANRKTLTVKIPWGMLNVADPSRALIIDDPDFRGPWPEPDTLKVSKGSVITLIGAFTGEIAGAQASDWFPRGGDGFTDTWNYSFSPWVHPRWQERQKPAVQALTAFFEGY